MLLKRLTLECILINVMSYGEREPQLSTLVALADFYDLSLDELACRERKRKTRN